MTTEYVQMLRDALTAANAGIEQIHDDWLEPESWNSAGCGQAAAHCLNISLAIDDALATPIPPAPLRPMSEAPRDGRKLLAYTLDRSPVIVWANRGEETRWTHSDGTMEPKWLLGWTIEAAIQAAKEQGCQS